MILELAVPWKYSLTNSNKIGLSSITVEVLDLTFARSTKLHTNVANKAMMDFMWLASFGRALDPSITSWGGFIRLAVRGDGYQTSSMHTIPFIDATPSGMRTLYTALIFAEEQCRKHNVPVAPITFDCPLYIKAAEIIAICSNEFQHIFARLGGFHWLMSAKGSIGYIMGGSELEELFSTVCQRFCSYLMTGHAYTRSFRAHLLAPSALISHLIDESGIVPTGHEEAEEAMSALLAKNVEADQLMELENVQLLVNAITVIIQEDDKDSRTLNL